VKDSSLPPLVRVDGVPGPEQVRPPPAGDARRPEGAMRRSGMPIDDKF
jgi:hypothetical protein